MSILGTGLCVLLLLVETSFGQLRKVSTTEDYQRINRALERENARNPVVDDRRVIQSLGYDPMSYLEFGFTHELPPGSFAGEPRSSDLGVTVPCKSELLVYAREHSSSPYNLGSLTASAFVAGSYVKWMNVVDILVDIWHAIADREQFREENIYQGLLEMMEAGSQLSLSENSSDAFGTALESLDLIKSAFDLSSYRQPPGQTGLTLREIVQFLDVQDFTLFENTLTGEQILRLRRMQLITRNLELRLRLSYNIDLLDYGLMAANITLDVWKAFAFVITVNNAYNDAVFDLGLLGETATDQAMRNAAHRARSTFESYLNALLEKMLSINETLLTYTRGAVSAFAALEALKAAYPGLAQGIAGGVFLWQAIHYAFGDLDDEFRKAGYVGQVEQQISTATFGALRQTFIASQDEVSLSRFRGGLRLTMLAETYCLDRLGRGFYSVGDNTVSEAIYRVLSGATGLTSREELRSAGEEAYRVSRKPLAIFKGIVEGDCILLR